MSLANALTCYLTHFIEPTSSQNTATVVSTIPTFYIYSYYIVKVNRTPQWTIVKASKMMTIVSRLYMRYLQGDVMLNNPGILCLLPSNQILISNVDLCQ